MKKIFFALAICGLIFTSCGNKSKDQNHVHDENCEQQHTHTHGEDCDHGHEHNHDHKHHSETPAQESFEVNQDSI